MTDIDVTVRQLQAAEGNRALAERQRAEVEALVARHASEEANDTRLRADAERKLANDNRIVDLERQLSRVMPQ
jgi:hypothetical protein